MKIELKELPAYSHAIEIIFREGERSKVFWVDEMDSKLTVHQLLDSARKQFANDVKNKAP